MRFRLIATVVASAVLASAQANAGILNVSGAIEVVPAPGNVWDGALESDTRIIAFAEQQ
jgi:hypothetical protein